MTTHRSLTALAVSTLIVAGSVGTASAAPQSVTKEPVGTAFTASGTTTAWRAVVKRGVLTTQGKAGRHRVRVKGYAFSKGVDFIGKKGRTTYLLHVRSGVCHDASGTDTGMVAELTIGKRHLRGCAVSG